MLNSILKRTEIKESFILLAFAALLQETLTKVTIVFVFIGALLAWFKQKPSAVLRNLLTLTVFGSYWLMYGKVIDPEVGLNFLTIIIVIKLLEKESERDQYMIMFGLLLLVSAGTLFERSLAYVFFFGLSFFLLIQDFYLNLKLDFRIRDWIKMMMWILPPTGILFFFAPRVMNPLPMGGPAAQEGEVGYTPEVNISEIESLKFNNKVVFDVQLEKKLPSEALYWRGNTLSFTDGWNWPIVAKDKHFSSPSPANPQNISGVMQKIRLQNKEDFLFFLDSPSQAYSAGGHFNFDDTHTVALVGRGWFPSYTVVSNISGDYLAEKISDRMYLQTSLKKKEKEWIHVNFKGESYHELKKEIQDYFLVKGFTYSLSPGKTPSLLSFLEEKKTGFCSHYASAVGLIFREKGVPARLVSGFLGGEYNPYGQFYQIGQSDAHVWVEILNEGKWVRVDPTAWIAPDRVILGAEGFMAQSASGAFNQIRRSPLWTALIDAQKWFRQWDYKFYSWLEKMDYYGQEDLFSKLNFKRKWLLGLIPFMIFLFAGIYFYTNKKSKVTESSETKLWKLFQAKVNTRDMNIPYNSVKEARDIILQSSDPKKAEILNLWDTLVKITFAGEKFEFDQLKKKISNL